MTVSTCAMDSLTTLILESLLGAPPVTLATRSNDSSDLSSFNCDNRSALLFSLSSCTLIRAISCSLGFLQERGLALGENDNLRAQRAVLPRDMQAMRSCYDNLLFAAAATANSAYGRFFEKKTEECRDPQGRPQELRSRGL
ncbi:hypothetical protein OROMI_015586 [Orobanche minor]